MKCPHCGKAEDLLVLVLDVMTPTQRRRYLLWIGGATMTFIAEREGASVNSVRKSIISAKKRAKKRLGGLKRG